jgi:hypothetical protein
MHCLLKVLSVYILYIRCSTNLVTIICMKHFLHVWLRRNEEQHLLVYACGRGVSIHVYIHLRNMQSNLLHYRPAKSLTCVYIHVQWNLSNPDSLGTEESVLISEVS